MTVDEAWKLINNLDHEEGIRRKLAPKYSLMQLGRTGEIIAIYRFKSSPTEAEYSEALQKHPGTVQLPAMAGLYPNLEKLRAAIDKSMWIFDKMKE